MVEWNRMGLIITYERKIMKTFIITLTLLTSTVFGQYDNWDYDYYGSGRTNKSNNLTIEVGDSVSGEYWVFTHILTIQTDSNWTASNMGFMVYNELESVWEPLYDENGSLIELPVVANKPIIVRPITSVCLKLIKFYKVTSGNPVAQATLPTRLKITTSTW